MDSAIIIGALALLFWVSMWLAITKLIGKFSGWEQLEQLYPDREALVLRTLFFQSIHFGKILRGMKYQNCVTIQVCDTGLRMKVWKLFTFFSKPVFIPWEVINAEPVEGRIFPAVCIKLGSRGTGSMTISSSTAYEIDKASGKKLFFPDAF